ncbi:MAG: gephyrin-like molybdotransferase Glp [Geminicoccaceae bacterium]
MSQLRDDCFALDDARIPVDQALAELKQRMACVVGRECVPLRAAAGRLLADDLIAMHRVPAFTNAAVDGYALRHADLAADQATALPLMTGRSAAGHPSQARLAAGHALRVLTGGEMPDGADSVLMQEDARLDGDRVIVPPGLTLGANRRLAGEDMQPGQVIVHAGQRLGARALAAAAALGHDQLRVHERLRVAVVSTGDELIEPGRALVDGGVYDSNRFLLTSLLERMGCGVSDYGIVADDAVAVERTLQQAAHNNHVVLTSGGASRGDEDHIVRTLERRGSVHFWQIAMKPGRPLAFGTLDGAMFLALPGNPVAAFVCFLLFARPLLNALSGAGFPVPERFPLAAAFDWRKKPGRTEYLRGVRCDRPRASGSVDRLKREGSGLITVLLAADGLIEVGHDVTEVHVGDPLTFLPFDGFGLDA